MRADRLLSLLMLLQTRGRMTAEALARELEVSERTIYRDIEALSMAGVPVYAERGPGGGVALMEHYRTQLTGMNEREVQALFMLSLPSPLADLGIRDDLRAALLKLTAAMPDRDRQHARQMQQRVHVDAAGWFRTDQPAPHLHTIYHAVLDDRRLWLTYRLPFETEVTRLVAPYGLVAKVGVWHVVVQRSDHIKVIRVTDVLSAHPDDAHFTRPPDFDLAAFWAQWCAETEQSRTAYWATVRAAPELLPLLRYHYGDYLDHLLARGGDPDADGWRALDLPFESFEAARERLLGYGRAAEVLAPEALRRSLIDFAQQIVDFYGVR